MTTRQFWKKNYPYIILIIPSYPEHCTCPYILMTAHIYLVWHNIRCCPTKYARCRMPQVKRDTSKWSHTFCLSYKSGTHETSNYITVTLGLCLFQLYPYNVARSHSLSRECMILYTHFLPGKVQMPLVRARENHIDSFFCYMIDTWYLCNNLIT